MGIAFLEKTAARRLAHAMTVDEFHRASEAGALPENVELIEGLVIEKMTKSPRHSNTVRKLQSFLLRIVPAEFLVSIEQPITTATSEPEPDLTVVEGRLEEFEKSHPTTARLVIEVSFSTLEFDRDKGVVYAGAAIPEYWIVNLVDDLIEVYTGPTKEGYRNRTLYRTGEIIKMSIGDVELAVKDIL